MVGPRGATRRACMQAVSNKLIQPDPHLEAVVKAQIEHHLQLNDSTMDAERSMRSSHSMDGVPPPRQERLAQRPQHAQQPQHTQQSQHAQQPQPAQHAQHPQHAQHAQHASHAQHPQHAQQPQHVQQSQQRQNPLQQRAQPQPQPPQQRAWSGGVQPQPNRQQSHDEPHGGGSASTGVTGTADGPAAHGRGAASADEPGLGRDSAGVAPGEPRKQTGAVGRRSGDSGHRPVSTGYAVPPHMHAQQQHHHHHHAQQQQALQQALHHQQQHMLQQQLLQQQALQQQGLQKAAEAAAAQARARMHQWVQPQGEQPQGWQDADAASTPVSNMYNQAGQGPQVAWHAHGGPAGTSYAHHGQQRVHPVATGPMTDAASMRQQGGGQHSSHQPMAPHPGGQSGQRPNMPHRPGVGVAHLLPAHPEGSGELQQAAPGGADAPAASERHRWKAMAPEDHAVRSDFLNRASSSPARGEEARPAGGGDGQSRPPQRVSFEPQRAALKPAKAGAPAAQEGGSQQGEPVATVQRQNSAGTARADGSAHGRSGDAAQAVHACVCAADGADAGAEGVKGVSDTSTLPAAATSPAAPAAAGQAPPTSSRAEPHINAGGPDAVPLAAGGPLEVSNAAAPGSGAPAKPAIGGGVVVSAWGSGTFASKLKEGGPPQGGGFSSLQRVVPAAAGRGKGGAEAEAGGGRSGAVEGRLRRQSSRGKNGEQRGGRSGSLGDAGVPGGRRNGAGGLRQGAQRGAAQSGAEGPPSAGLAAGRGSRKRMQKRQGDKPVDREK